MSLSISDRENHFSWKDDDIIIDSGSVWGVTWHPTPTVEQLVDHIADLWGYLAEKYPKLSQAEATTKFLADSSIDLTLMPPGLRDSLIRRGFTVG